MHAPGRHVNSHQVAITAVIRAELVSGELPRATAEKCWVGKGTSRACMGWELSIPPDATEHEADLPASSTGLTVTLRFHQQYLGIWREERTRLGCDVRDADQLEQWPSCVPLTGHGATSDTVPSPGLFRFHCPSVTWCEVAHWWW
jgi:hypothetical protein